MSAKHEPSERRFRLEEYRLKRGLAPTQTGLTPSNVPIRFLPIAQRLFQASWSAEQKKKLEHSGTLPSLDASNYSYKRNQAASPQTYEVLALPL